MLRGLILVVGTVALVAALSAVVEARAGIATALLAAAVALIVTLPRRRGAPAAAPAGDASTLGADLHDRVGPALAGLRLSIAARRRGADVPDLAQQAEDTAAEVRQVLAGLGPVNVGRHGLVAALELLAARLAPEGRPAITVRSPGALPHLDAGMEEAAYAIAVEALTNAVRHAGARRIEIELRDDLTLVVADDGRGFESHRVTPGVGLASMRRRAPLTITSDEHGTRVEAQISRLFRDNAP